MKDEKYYAEKAIEDITAIKKYVGNGSYEEFLSDDRTLDAIMFRLVQLIENVKNIPVETKGNFPNVPWGKIIGFRNGIVHEYGKTDYTTVYETIAKDLDELRLILEEIAQ